MMANELQELRDWRDGASLTLSDLREQLGRALDALKSAQGWLKMIAHDRPKTSDIHRVLALVDAALATEAGTAETGNTDSVHEGAGPKDNAQGGSDV
jgi:hypothetical protein